MSCSFGRYSGFVDPAKVDTLVVPVGRWTRDNFRAAVDQLRCNGDIRLLDVGGIDGNLFKPQRFPQGRIFLNVNTSISKDELDLFLYDFEPFRKTFVVIGLVNDSSDASVNLQTLKDRFPTVICSNLIYVGGSNSGGNELEEQCVFNCDILNETNNLKTVLCDISRNFLMALDRYYSSYKHVTLRSPGAIGGSSVMKTTFTCNSNTAIASAPSGKAHHSSKRISGFEMTTNNIKRSASLQLARSLSTSDNKAQQKSQGRQMKILGNFQLLSGQYIDALNSFSEAIVSLHIVRDYLWLGSALDGIAICFLLLSYLQVPYQIPTIIQELCPAVASEETVTSGSSTPRNSVSITPLGISPRTSTVSAKVSNGGISIENLKLPYLIKSISDLILHYYDVSLSHNSEYAPQSVYCELVLKTITFMVACKNDETLSQETMKRTVFNNEYSLDHEIETANTLPCFSKMEIYYFAHKMFELQLRDMDLIAQRNIYFTMSKVYDSIGFQRKKTFVLRLLLVTLVATTSNVTWHSDYHELLKNMTVLYGIEEPDSIESESRRSSSSWVMFQKKALQLCLSVAEKVQDIECIEKFSILLITQYTSMLAKSEQQKLFKTHIFPLLRNGVIKKYWDPSLLRNLKVNRKVSQEIDIEIRKIANKPSKVLSSHQGDDNKLSDKVKEDEVFNPFKRGVSMSSVIPTSANMCLMPSTFLMGDIVELVCSFQNPFNFDIEITSIALTEENNEFANLVNMNGGIEYPVIIKAQSIQSVSISLLLTKYTHPDFLQINSLMVSVFDTESQEFFISTEENNSIVGNNGNDEVAVAGLSIKVLPAQPELQILKTTNMINNQWMMLDGTKSDFSVSLKNKSLDSPINYINISHNTNYEKALKPEYWKQLAADELFELETHLEWFKKDVIKITSCPDTINPNSVSQIDFKLDAKHAHPDFSAFDIIIEYGIYAEDGSYVYLKKIVIPYKVTLKRSIEISNLDIIPITEPFSKELSNVDWIKYLMDQTDKEESSQINDFVLLLLDMRNSWIDELELQVEFEDFKSGLIRIETGHTNRVIVPMRKLTYTKFKFSSNAIPKLIKGRQFIQSGLSEEKTVEMRESFWCREHIIRNLNCVWKDTGRSENGEVNVRQFIDKFDTRLVSAMYQSCIPYTVKLVLDKKTTTSCGVVTAEVTISPTKLPNHNYSQTVYLTFMLFDNNLSTLLPISDKRVLCNGNLSKPVRVSEKMTTNLQLLPIELGEYEICAGISQFLESDYINYSNTSSAIMCVK